MTISKEVKTVTLKDQQPPIAHLNIDQAGGAKPAPIKEARNFSRDQTLHKADSNKQWVITDTKD